MALTSQGALQEVRKIAAALNPGEIRQAAARPLRAGLVASGESGYQALERFLCTGMDAASGATVERTSLEHAASFDFLLCEDTPTIGPLPAHAFRLHPRDPEATAVALAGGLTDSELALGRQFPALRHTVAEKILYRIASENAMFSVVSALPNVVPNVLELPWAAGEFASDTAFLTMNQIRMAMQLAALHGRPTGYLEQKVQIAAIAGGAFGWRALARQLVGKIPLGGGLIPKAAIAFAGTWVLGVSLEKMNRMGRGLSRAEKREAYSEALTRGKAVAGVLAPNLSRPLK